jgi:hypothetical protein
MALAGDHVAVLVDGYELTGDHNSISIDDSRKALCQTTFGDAVKNCIPGQRMMKLQHGGFMNADSARSHPALKGATLEGVVAVLVGQNADPVVGDPVYCLKTLQSYYQVAPQFGEVIPFKATFANKGELGGWGVALAVPVEFTNTSNGSGVDNGAASSNGGSAYLNVLTAAGSDTYTIVVEGSATGAFSGEESTLATFALDASAIGSERVAISGSIPQYTRWKATRSGSAGDTVKIAVALIRG